MQDIQKMLPIPNAINSTITITVVLSAPDTVWRVFDHARNKSINITTDELLWTVLDVLNGDADKNPNWKEGK